MTRRHKAPEPLALCLFCTTCQTARMSQYLHVWGCGSLAGKTVDWALGVSQCPERGCSPLGEKVTQSKAAKKGQFVFLATCSWKEALGCSQNTLEGLHTLSGLEKKSNMYVNGALVVCTVAQFVWALSWVFMYLSLCCLDYGSFSSTQFTAAADEKTD